MTDVIRSLAQNPPTDPIERKKLYDAARELMFVVENRHDLTHRVYFSGVQLSLADIAEDLHIFTVLANAPERLWTPGELVDHLKCDSVLLTRVLRGLAAYGMITVNGNGEYGSASGTSTLADAGVAGCIRNKRITRTRRTPAMALLSSVIGRSNTCGSGWNPIPEHLKALMINMAAQRMGQESWIDDPKLFPKEYLQLSDDGVASGRVLFVDIGSGSGHQSISLRQSHRELQGRVIVQDLAYTIAATDEELLTELHIEPMDHDFFTPQPIQGAKVYYMRNILHDFPDDRCCEILRRLRAAAGQDSMIIIDDIVVKGPEAQWRQVNYDMIMISCMSAMERTVRQWEGPLRATGFGLKEIREYDIDKGDSIIIAGPIESNI